LGSDAVVVAAAIAVMRVAVGWSVFESIVAAVVERLIWWEEREEAIAVERTEVDIDDRVAWSETEDTTDGQRSGGGCIKWWRISGLLKW
jgi:hypothetical protein